MLWKSAYRTNISLNAHERKKVIRGVECKAGYTLLFDEEGKLTARIKKPVPVKETGKSVP